MQKRQGDLLIESVEALPAGAEPVEGLVLAEGEATGHKHQLDVGELFRTQDGQLYLRTEKLATLRHEEHAPLTFPPGTYRVIRQREYQPQSWREVKD